MSRKPVAVLGAGGRMGEAIARVLDASEDFELAWRADARTQSRALDSRLATDLSGLAAGDAAGILDFSSPEGTIHAAASAARIGCALVSGTTGLTDAARAALDEAARRVPVCWAANFSLGVPLLRAALREAAARAPAGWQLEIIETHHSRKADAPSGTALALAEAWRERRGGRLVHGRQGRPGPRGADEIGIHAVRAGDIVGEHRILLGGPGETIEAIHRVQDRTAFAAGCVEALRRLLRQGPGKYDWDELCARG